MKLDYFPYNKQATRDKDSCIIIFLEKQTNKKKISITKRQHFFKSMNKNDKKYTNRLQVSPKQRTNKANKNFKQASTNKETKQTNPQSKQTQANPSPISRSSGRPKTPSNVNSSYNNTSKCSD